VLLSGLLAGAATSLAQSRREVWNQPMEPFRVIGNIHYVGTHGLAAYLITSPAGHILLDAALAESATQIERNITALGFRLSDVRVLLNSHAHYDHSGGLAQLKRATGAKLIAMQGDRSALEGGFYLGSEGDRSLDSVPVKVDRTVRDGEKVSLGDTMLTANLTPGHTRGCTSWSTTVTEAGKKHRVLFFCSASVAANRLVAPPQYDGIVRDYRRTFARAKRMKVDVFLAPHPEFFRMHEKRQRLGTGPNPFVDPAEFAVFIAKAEADFQEQLAVQQRAAAAASPAK
jgi:metallo-beta-lactamase class B